MSTPISNQHREMAQVLANIVKDKAVWVAERKKAQPLSTFKQSLTLSDRDFYAALISEKTAFILECKKASPSKGLIRESFNLEEIAAVYAHHASAISVLTDEKYFQGQFDFLPRVRSVTTQPILCKDFMIDPYQVYLARHYQADAILLMLSVLDDAQYEQLASIAHSLGLGILTEVSNEEELQRAIQLKAKVVGINNRNLRDLTIDLNRTKQLAPQLPKETIVISESGIYNNEQVRDLAHFANGFLIGSSLMAQDNIELAVRSVTMGEHKVCGLTSIDNAQSAYDAGAVWGGFIFVPQSKRYIDVEQAKSIADNVPLRFAGVFQNHSVEQIITVCQSVSLSAIQLHGDEDQAFVSQLRHELDQLALSTLSHIEIWKAYGVAESLPSLFAHDIDRHLLDRQVGSQKGGTGETFDWQLIEHIDPHHVMLAGGITPENAKQAAHLGLRGLDLNSGVESAPGQKDPQKLHRAFHAITQF